MGLGNDHQLYSPNVRMCNDELLLIMEDSITYAQNTKSLCRYNLLWIVIRLAILCAMNMTDCSNVQTIPPIISCMKRKTHNKQN